MIGIDSNVLVRYLTQDNPGQAAIAAHFVDHELSAERQGHVSLVALAETLWVLQTHYAAGKAALMPMIAALAADPRFRVQDEAALWLALETCESADVDVADALIHQLNALHGCTHTVTFDRKATRMSGMVLLQRPA
jgi:predicted nucleic-acid-binding protein